MAGAPEGRRGDRRRRGAARAQRIRRRGVAQARSRERARDRRGRAPAHQGRADMSDPALGLTMLALIVVVIMMGFPTAFTLMGLGMVFGFIAMHQTGQPWSQNRVFDLMVERTYGAMNNDTLISIPLF